MSPVYLLFLGLLLAVLSNVTTNTTCGDGFIMMENGTCVDEDECKDEIEVCGNNSVCTNTIGGYYCQCKAGYQNNKRKLNFTADDELQCKDINECTENKPICGPNALCNNINGSYFCMCAEGFVASNKQERFNGSQNVTCNGLLLAVLSNVTTNTACDEGFIMMENGTCVDEDECKDQKEVCGNNAVCTNTIGGYYCQCKAGYQNNKRKLNFTADDGLQCKDINECTENKPICGPNAKCINTVGSYSCMCAEGFVASNKQERFNGSQNVTCNDIDECTSARRICGNNADCHNTYGSYYCICVSGGDAVTNQDGSHTCTDESLHVSDVEFIKTSVFCTHAETSNGYRHLNPNTFTFLPLILCILMFSHIYIS